MVKCITYSNIPGYWVDVWRNGTFPDKKKTDNTECRRQAVLVTFLWFRKLTCSCTEGMSSSSTRPPNIRYTTASDEFTRPSLTLVLQATNAGERCKVSWKSNHKHNSKKVQSMDIYRYYKQTWSSIISLWHYRWSFLLDLSFCRLHSSSHSSTPH